jgi:hypothetical protein
MDQEAFDQTTEDLFAYVESLDASEALGELLHVGALYRRASGASLAIGQQPTMLALMLLPICVGLAEQVAKGTGAMVPTAPPHDGSVHTCILIARAIEASR